MILCCLVAIAGGLVLRWRIHALAGFGLGPANRPLLVAFPLGNAAVLFLGAILLLGPVTVLILLASWPWALFALATGIVGGALLAHLFVRGDLASAREQMARFEREYGGMDAMTAVMTMHLKNGTITQEQFDEFIRTRASGDCG